MTTYPRIGQATAIAVAFTRRVPWRRLALYESPSSRPTRSPRARRLRGDHERPILAAASPVQRRKHHADPGHVTLRHHRPQFLDGPRLDLYHRAGRPGRPDGGHGDGGQTERPLMVPGLEPVGIIDPCLLS